jgi:hypothetical protein
MLRTLDMQAGGQSELTYAGANPVIQAAASAASRSVEERSLTQASLSAGVSGV